MLFLCCAVCWTPLSVPHFVWPLRIRSFPNCSRWWSIRRTSRKLWFFNGFIFHSFRHHINIFNQLMEIPSKSRKIQFNLPFFQLNSASSLFVLLSLWGLLKTNEKNESLTTIMCRIESVGENIMTSPSANVFYKLMNWNGMGLYLMIVSNGYEIHWPSLV